MERFLVTHLLTTLHSLRLATDSLLSSLEPPSMVMYILFVAVLNLTVGFALALYSRQRYWALVALTSESADPAAATTTAAQGAPRTEQPTQAEPEPATAAEETPVDKEPIARPPGGTSECPTDGNPPEDSASSDLPPDEHRQISASEASVEKLKSEVEQYQHDLLRVDDTLRDCREDPDANVFRSCVDTLRRANKEYRTSRHQAQQTFQKAHADSEESQPLSHDLQEAVQRQDEQIEQVNSVIDGLGGDTDVGEDCRRLQSQTAKLLGVNNDLRDTLEETAIVVARRDGRLGSADTAKRNDPLTELSTRAELEARLVEWWEKDPHRARQLNLAMLDIDGFTSLNERHGQRVCDRVLRAIAQLLCAESRSHSLAARFSGQRFILLFPDVDVRFTTSVVERIRQTVEMAHFQQDDEDIRITVSCAVIETTSDDTSDSLYTRAESTLHEAKRYGRNRTFLHEGRYPTPVVPPNLTLEEKYFNL